MRCARYDYPASEEPQAVRVMTVNIKPLATELIAELDAEATNFKIVLLVVIFPEAPTIFIRSDRTNRFGALTAALARGGEPIGFIATRDQGESVFLFGRVLRGLEGERVVSQYLASLNDEISEMLRQERNESSPEWVN
jgi:hypothetical protein